jgi:hypothetical protein
VTRCELRHRADDSLVDGANPVVELTRSPSRDFPAVRLVAARHAHQQDPIALKLDHSVVSPQRAERTVKECKQRCHDVNAFFLRGAVL